MQTKEELEAREQVSLNIARIQSRVNRAQAGIVDDRAPHLR